LTPTNRSLADHPIFRDLRAVREPRPRMLQVVEALCRRRELPAKSDPDRRPRLPRDEEIAKELGISRSAVRTALDEMALLLDGLEVLEVRARIYVWYWHSQWEKGAT
jgi:DNA-binding FadR family transcriptional regulator